MRKKVIAGNWKMYKTPEQAKHFVAAFLRARGYDVRINEVYKGVEIVKRQGRPAERRHSLQIEVDRGLYMNQKTLEKSAGFAGLQADITALIAALGEFARAEAARLSAGGNTK